jgi:hypothetical protein
MPGSAKAVRRRKNSAASRRTTPKTSTTMPRPCASIPDESSGALRATRSAAGKTRKSTVGRRMNPNVVAVVVHPGPRTPCRRHRNTLRPSCTSKLSGEIEELPEGPRGASGNEGRCGRTGIELRAAETVVRFGSTTTFCGTTAPLCVTLNACIDVTDARNEYGADAACGGSFVALSVSSVPPVSARSE